MKKILVSIVVLAMMLGVMLVPAAAAENDAVLKYTPTVDGVLDEAYTQSWSGTVDTSDPRLYGEDDYTDNDLAATVYLLHDDEFLYICGVVTGDTSIVDTECATWAMDGLDIWLCSYVWNQAGSRSKLPLTAFADELAGNAAIGAFDNGLAIDHSKSVVAAVRGETSYVVEAKVPMYNTHAEVGDVTIFSDPSVPTINISLQINNMSDPYDSTIKAGCFGYQWAYDGQDGTYVLTISDEEPVFNNDAPSTGEPTPDKDNAKTGDVTVSVLAGLMALSVIGAAVVITKKN